MEKNVYDSLSAPLPKDAIQRTKGADTRKGYDTTGYAYQYVVNRFNEVVGIGGWGYAWEVINVTEGKYSTGKPFYDITTNVTITVGNASMSMPGGHIAAIYADALKGAITNGFKKCAAMFGIGKEAYEGTIDDDNKPLPEDHGQPVEVLSRKVTVDKDAQKKALFAIGDLMNTITDKDKKQKVRDLVFKGKTKAEINAMPVSALEYALELVQDYAEMTDEEFERFWEEVSISAK